MSIAAATGDLARGYEALRAPGRRGHPGEAPRGLAVLRRPGLVAWMRALPPEVRGPTDRAIRRRSVAWHLDGLDGELVSVLTEMAIGAGMGVCAVHR